MLGWGHTARWRRPWRAALRLGALPLPRLPCGVALGLPHAGAGTLERGAPPALAGEVPPNQPLVPGPVQAPPQQTFSLGQTQVRQVPTEPPLPQTVTPGRARVEGNRGPLAPAAEEVAARELAAKAAAERMVAEQQALAREATAGREQAAAIAEAVRRQEHEQLRRAVRAEMEMPSTTDPTLTHYMSEIYRPGAAVGSGSTAAAVRAERAPGVQVGGKTHSIKAQEQIVNLRRWFRNNLTASPGDRAAAENVIQDMIDALAGN